MRERAIRVMITCALALAGACGDDSGNGDCDGGTCADDGGGPDVMLTCADPGGPMCGETELCIGGQCVNNTCATANPCGADDQCALTCVPSVDPCMGVMCGNEMTCVNGQCIAGCFSPSPCLNKDCPDDEFCYFGACLPKIECDAPCGAGFMCQVACRPPNPCDGVTCAANQFCAQGECIDNVCFGVTCPAGEACNGGVCVTTCDCPGGCGANGTCIGNTCQCVPDCAAKACGDDDGCGGECDVQCPQGGQFDCNGPSNSLSCTCVPSCAGKPCGADNGCGGDCNGACTADPGETCQGTQPDLTCACPVGRAECSGDCCPNASDSCETKPQMDPGILTPAAAAEACCTSGRACTAAGRTDVCCTGAGLACVDNNNVAGTESCCTVARQKNDTTSPEIDQDCCLAGETAIDTLVDADTQKDDCCTSTRACGEISTCCAAGEVCATAPGAANDRCCPTGKVNCDGQCVDPCAGGQTQYLCNDNIPNNEVCCASNVDRCQGAPNGAANTACCGAIEDRCYPNTTAPIIGAGNAPICCSDPESYCNDSGACCPNNEICLGDTDGFNNTDQCCAAGQVIDPGGACCTPTCPDPASVTCGQLDSCGFDTCPGTCNAVSSCIDSGGDYQCQPNSCSPVCNTNACEDCIGGNCVNRCLTQGGTCIGGICQVL